MTVLELDVDMTPAEMDAIWQACQQEVVTRRSRFRRVDGSTFPIEVRIAVVDQIEQPVLLAIVRDVTEREQFNEALQLYNAQLEGLVEKRTQQLQRNIQQTQAILESSSDAIALAESNGDIRSTNPAFKALFGSSVNRAIEQILKVVIDPDHIEAVTQALYTVLKQGESARVEARMASVGGAEIDMDIAMTPVRSSEDQQNIGIVVSLRDISELKEINRFKTRFVANAAHDLANPIANVKLYLHALEQSPENTERYLEVLHGQTRRLEHLVNDLRMLSQLDQGMTQFNLEPLDLHRLLGDILRVHRAQAEANQQVLVCDLAAEDAVVLADDGKLERVIVNLLANALNYTPEGGTITVRTSLEGEQVSLLVADTGIGIAPQDLPHIFERFYRSDDAKMTGVEGTGLGLAIVKEIVEAHRGEITVSSQLGQGTQFRVTLPHFSG
ncbi:MAG: PAS domain S-box protein, partial [Anaerolineae bacterium]|nr:PAS domain S-box protein [Anaerolineae bacterium]